MPLVKLSWTTLVGSGGVVEKYTGLPTAAALALGGLVLFAIGLLLKMILTRLVKAALDSFETWLVELREAVGTAKHLTSEMTEIKDAVAGMRTDMGALRQDLESGFKARFDLLELRVKVLEGHNTPRTSDGTMGDRKLP